LLIFSSQSIHHRTNLVGSCDNSYLHKVWFGLRLIFFDKNKTISIHSN